MHKKLLIDSLGECYVDLIIQSVNDEDEVTEAKRIAFGNNLSEREALIAFVESLGTELIENPLPQILEIWGDEAKVVPEDFI
jgi:hypothetical protein